MKAVTSAASAEKQRKEAGKDGGVGRRPASEWRRSTAGVSKSARGRGVRRCHGSPVRSSTLKSIVSPAAEAKAKRRGLRRVGKKVKNKRKYLRLTCRVPFQTFLKMVSAVKLLFLLSFFLSFFSFF